VAMDVDHEVLDPMAKGRGICQAASGTAAPAMRRLTQWSSGTRLLSYGLYRS
jgi:hypothetical protein